MKPSPPFPVCNIAMVPSLLQISLHSCKKSGSSLGTRLCNLEQSRTNCAITVSNSVQNTIANIMHTFSKTWFELQNWRITPPPVTRKVTQNTRPSFLHMQMGLRTRLWWPLDKVLPICTTGQKTCIILSFHQTMMEGMQPWIRPWELFTRPFTCLHSHHLWSNYV